MNATFMPFTKILLTFAVAFWAILFDDPLYLLGLAAFVFVLLLTAGIVKVQGKAVGMLVIFAIILGLVQYVGGGSLDSAYVTALRMLCMTWIFLLLLVSTSLQDLTAALVTQCKIPYAYAFMFTAALRFVPDFVAESKAVQEAQACRGADHSGSFLKRMKSYLYVIQPLLLKSLGRSEMMALALELRGFGNEDHSFVSNVTMRTQDYVVTILLAVITIGFVYLVF